MVQYPTLGREGVLGPSSVVRIMLSFILTTTFYETKNTQPILEFDGEAQHSVTSAVISFTDKTSNSLCVKKAALAPKIPASEISLKNALAPTIQLLLLLTWHSYDGQSNCQDRWFVPDFVFTDEQAGNQARVGRPGLQ